MLFFSLLLTFKNYAYKLVQLYTTVKKGMTKQKWRRQSQLPTYYMRLANT